MAIDVRTKARSMARYSSPGESGTSNEEIIYIQRPLPPYDDGFRRRLWGLLTVVLLSLCLLLGRTWQLQVLQGEHFLRLSEQNRLRSLRTQSLRANRPSKRCSAVSQGCARWRSMPLAVKRKSSRRAQPRPGWISCSPSISSYNSSPSGSSKVTAAPLWPSTRVTARFSLWRV